MRTSLASQSSLLNNALFYYLPASLFAFVPLIFTKEPSCSIFLFCGLFLYVKSMLWLNVYQSTASTAQHSVINPAQSSKPSTCRSERDNTSKQTRVGGSQHVVEQFIACCVVETNEEIEICPAYKIVQALTKQLRWCDTRRVICLYFQSQYVTYNAALCRLPFHVFRVCMRCPCSPGAWSSWDLQVVRLHLKSGTALSASFAFCHILPCERAWRDAPAARGAKRLVCNTR